MALATRWQPGPARRPLQAAVAAGGLTLAAGAGATAAASPLIAIALAVAALCVAASFRSLGFALALFTFLSFFGTSASTITGSLTVAKLGGILITGLWLLVIAGRRSRVPLIFRDLTGYAAVVLVFTAWEVVSILWARDAAAALSAGARLVQGLVLVFVVYTAVSRPEHVRWIANAFVAGAVLAALVALAQAGSASPGFRPSGTLDDPNQFAAVVVPAMMLALFAFASSRSRARWFYVLALPVLLVGLVRADSQGGLAALAAGLLAACVVGGPVRRRARVLTALLAAFATIYYTFLTAAPPQLTEGEDSRLNLWRAAIAVWRDHKLFGVGVGNFVVVEPQYALSSVSFDRVDLILKPDVTHNTYLNVLADTGVVGLALLVTVIVAALFLALRSARALERAGCRELSILGRGVVAATIAILVAYVFLSAQYEKQLWLLVGICAALHGVARSAPTRPPSRS